MDRRDFLKRIALGTSAGVVVPPSSAVTAAANSSEIATDRVDLVRLAQVRPWFFQGAVIGRTRGAFVITSSRAASLRVRLSALTTVWKEIETTAESIELGDFLYVKGERQPDGSVLAVDIWANIGWHRGVVTAVNSGSLRVDSTGGRVIYLTPNTILFDRKTPNNPNALTIKTGQYVEALGAFVHGGHLRATRIWITSP